MGDGVPSAPRPKSNKDLVKCLMNLSSRCGQFQYTSYIIRLLGTQYKMKSQEDITQEIEKGQKAKEMFS
jgi:hypothetical protein